MTKEVPVNNTDIVETAEKEDMIQELKDIQEYLEQMDEAVTTSHTAMEEVSGYSEQMIERTEILQETLTELEELVQSYMKSQDSENAAYTKQMDVVDKSLSDARKEVESVRADILSVHNPGVFGY